MSRQQRIFWVFGAAVALMAVVLANRLWRADSSSYCQQQDTCPNVVFIILDDMAWDHFGFLSPEIQLTPNMDALAADGHVFTDAYNSNSRCRASLATLLTGQYPHQNKIYSNHGVLEMRDTQALPILLEKAGYKTFAGGKFWEGSPSLMDFTASDVDTFHFVRQSQDKLNAFLQQYAGKSPLFIWWAPMMPHLPHDAPENFQQMISLDSIALPFAMEETQAQDYRKNEKSHRATIRWLDEELGQLRARLAQHGLQENTWIVLLSDNGWDAARTAKGSAYDIGVRTPMIISGPGVEKRKNAQLISTQNIYGSILNVIGLPVQADRAAEVDVLALARGERVKNDNVVYWASYPSYTGKSEPTPRAGRDVYALSLRQDAWQYTFYIKSYEHPDEDSKKPSFVIHSGMQGAPNFQAGDEELFNLAEDPYSENNLSGDLQNHQLLETYRQQTLQWWQQSGGDAIDALKNCEEMDSVLCQKYRSTNVVEH